MIFILLTIIISFILGIVGSVLNTFRGIFGMNKNKQAKEGETKVHKTQSKKTKIIDKNEGEYVDFEDMNSKY